jgi:hypothetical protein
MYPPDVLCPRLGLGDRTGAIVRKRDEYPPQNSSGIHRALVIMGSRGRIRALREGRANPPRGVGTKPESLAIEADEAPNSDGLWREPGVEKEVREQVQDGCKAVFRAIERRRP